MGRVSRNDLISENMYRYSVTSRMGRVSRNCSQEAFDTLTCVTSRMGRVSRNLGLKEVQVEVGESRPAWDV